MSQFKNPEFRKLQRDWYKKLKEDGFEDIEDTNSKEEFLKEWHSSSFQLSHDPATFEAKQEYFYLATKFLSSYQFPTEVERIIWTLHAEGKSLREIAVDLQTKGHRLFKDKVHHIVKNLEAVMRGIDSPYEKKSQGQMEFESLFPKVPRE